MTRSMTQANHVSPFNTVHQPSHVFVEVDAVDLSDPQSHVFVEADAVDLSYFQFHQRLSK